jgi:hypothetical protein
MNPKNNKNWLVDKWLLSALKDMNKASTPDQVHDKWQKWAGGFLSLAVNHFITQSKRGKHLGPLAMKAYRNKALSKKFLTEYHKVLQQISGVRWAK